MEPGQPMMQCKCKLTKFYSYASSCRPSHHGIMHHARAASYILKTLGISVIHNHTKVYR